MNDHTNKKQLFWSRKMIEKFIQIYKENECLYDMNHGNYNNKMIKSEALKNILQKMQQYLPNLDLHDVLEKIKAIRTQYATEISLIEEAKALGNNYVSNLWCFEQLEFLRKHINIAKESGHTNRNEAQSNNEDSDYTEYENTKTKSSHTWNREETEIFIKWLKQHPLLYNPKHKDYTNNVLRKLEHNKLLKKVKVLNHKITISDMRKKIHTLRSQYVKEVGLLKKSYENNEIYTPKLWCFDTLANMYQDDFTQFYNKETKNNENDTSNEYSYNGNEDDCEMHLNEPTNFNDQNNDENEFDFLSEDSEMSVQSKTTTKREYHWDRDQLNQFINMLSEHPVLYDTQHKDYTNNVLRKKYLIQLLQEARRLDSNITMQIMRKKIRSLRNQYQREVRYLKMAYNKNEIYTPKLWCFDRLCNLYKEDITLYYKKDDKHNENSMSNISSEYSFDFEEISDICDFNEDNNVDVIENVSILRDEELHSNMVNDCTNTLVEETLENSLPDQNTNLKNSSTQTPAQDDDVNYEWLGDLVVSQLQEIAPTFHTEFAWDVQCLIRKYILKTKTNSNEVVTTTKSSTNDNIDNKKSTNTSHDLLLSKTSNVSFNISFV